MNPLIVIREEIICLVILLFLLVNSQFYKMGKDNTSFLRLCIYAIGHVTLDIITVYTVNHPEIVPPVINRLLHIGFYLCAIMFTYEFFSYTTALTYPDITVRKIRKWSLILPVLYLISLPFLPITYEKGRGTNYSFGPAVFAGYACALLFVLASVIILIKNHKKLERHIIISIVPMLSVMLFVELAQILVPELLFTGGCLTIITIGVFFALENPAMVFKTKALMDVLTGFKSRSCYEMDFSRLESRYQDPLRPPLSVGLVFCDINGLKQVNDTYGHPTGDEYIGLVAAALLTHLKSAKDIYRMGGDEFLAVYLNETKEKIQKEMAAVHAACKDASSRHPYPVSLAMGCAMSGPEYPSLDDILRAADHNMYANKWAAKHGTALLQDDDSTLDKTGLTDRIFNAFAAASDKNYFYVCNLNTNVSRLSKKCVDYFGLPGEYVYDIETVWEEFIHPEDRTLYRAIEGDIFSGKSSDCGLEYRVRTKTGQYTICTTRGVVLKGENGEPDLFAGIITNHGIMDRVDPVTGLYNDHEFTTFLHRAIAKQEPTALMEVGISTFSTINALYGYPYGNDVLCQFAALLKKAAAGRGPVFRLDGAKFVLCLRDGTVEDLKTLYARIQKSAEANIHLESLSVPVSIYGSALILDRFPADEKAIKQKLIYSLNQSRNEFHGTLAVFDADNRTGQHQNLELMADIRQSVLQGCKNFKLVYQPIMDAHTYEIVGAEALLRFEKEPYGLVAPGRFIPWLENDPCFFQLGNWIFRRAFADMKHFTDILPDFRLNVNITVSQLEHSDFRQTVIDILKETRFPATSLCLELTERCRALNSEFLREELQFFHSHGIRISMDDWGTGASSLGLLLELPVDELKLDMSLIRDIQEKPANQVFVQAILDAANRLGYTSCLEGIETKETLACLNDYGASCYQGYYFSRPVDLEQLRSLIQESPVHP